MATTLTWLGGRGRFDNPNDWNPTGVPNTGDTAVIDTGTVKIRNETVIGVNFELHGTTQATEPVLALRNATLDSNIGLNGQISPAGSTFFGGLDVSGRVTSTGDIVLGSGRGQDAGGNLTVDIRANSQFINTGTISLDAASLTIEGTARHGNDDKNGHQATFVNNGTVENFGGFVRIDVPVVGTGTFEAPPSSLGQFFEFADRVGHGITVSLAGEQFTNLVTIEKPMQFLAAITGFGSGLPNSIELPNTEVTSECFSNNHLKLFDYDRLVGNLNIIGDFTSDNFTLSPDASGGTEIRFTHPAASSLTTTMDAHIGVPLPIDS